MISKKDSKPILIKQAIGGKQTNKDDTIYETNWQTVYGLVSGPSGTIYNRQYGIEEVYDKVIILNATSKTRAIQPNTIVMVDDMPTSNYEYGDYDIMQIYPEVNGEIRIGLNKRESIDMPKLYFNYNGNILYYQLNYDKTKLKAYISNKIKLPFNVNDYLWTRKPTNIESTHHRIKLIKKSKIGFDSRLKPFYELTFEEVPENDKE